MPSQVSRQIREEITGITVTLSQILSRFDVTDQEAHDSRLKARYALLKEICEREDLECHGSQELIADIEMLSVSDVSEQAVQGRVNNAIIETLGYYEMTNRFEDVDEAHPETFEWAFSAPAEEQLWSDLSGWLKEGDGVYWVSGKIGSGKSTFMKYLVDEKRKRLYELLRVWARDSELCVATFFFWNSGTKLQKSQAGFLRALLFQVLVEHPQLTPIIFPREWSTSYSREVGWLFDGKNASPPLLRRNWNLTQLKEAFRALSSQTIKPLKVCFIVDGLDEFDGDDGDYEGMGAFFKEITAFNHIKVCLSSRPWVVFEDIFRGFPNLKLQNLTYRDIETYVHDKFHQNNSFLNLASREPAAAPALLKEIVEKADGVFLWVKLVVRSLLSGVRNRDDLADLSEQLRRLPRELIPLYNHLFQLIEPYERWASQAIQILRCNRDLCNASSGDSSGIYLEVRPITISEFVLVMSENVHASFFQNLSREEFQLKREDMKIRITARCAGFLEVSNIPGTSVMGPGSLIDYFHRSAKDFLESDEVWAKLLTETENTNFNPAVALMRSCLRYIKVHIAFSDESIESFIHNDVEASPRVVAFMAYAHRADSHIPSRGTQTALIDQLNDLICKYDIEGNWLYDLAPRLKGRFKLFEISTLLGLEGYLRDKLKVGNKSQLEAAIASLLQYILSDTFDISGLLSRIPKVLSLLLHMGACSISTFPSTSEVLRGSQHRLAELQKRTGVFSPVELDCAQRLHSSIEEFLGNAQLVPAVQRNIPKRLAGEIEDVDASTHPTKMIKREDHRV
jgi:hypothetical protein